MVTNGGNNGKISTIDVRTGGTDETADIDKAISVAGYGTFNVLLFLAALPVAWTGIFDTTTSAFIIASAECDLRLTFFRKGVLSAFPFLGMAMTGFLWDHLTPYVGARNLFVLGLLADSILNVLSTAVDSYYAFLAIKFFSGVLAGGPFSMVTTYLSEFHSPSYKASFARWGGLAVNAAIIVPAIIAFIVSPLSLTVNIFNRPYTSWRIYLLICSMVPVLGLVTASTLPQSPKYLMEIGKPDEALKLLRRMYAVNKNKPAHTFPIKALLVWENASLSRRAPFNTNSEKIRLTCYNAKLLFSSRYLRAVLFINFLQFGSMLGFNTMRLWVPHLFIILNNFDYERWTNDRPPTMREMLDPRMSVPAKPYLSCPDFQRICLTWKISAAVYENSAIIALSAVTFSFLVGTISTTTFRKKGLMLAAFLVSVISSFGINWAQSPPYMLTLAAAIIVTTRIAGNIVTAVNIDVIPIPLRSTSLNMLVIVGNVAAVLGNFAFSALLEAECLVGFMGIGCLLFACFCLSFFHPRPVKTSEKSLAMSNA
ncbi:Synaptic vesicle glycoprotein 2A [Eufriesea mexicana]|uniref:Synaptic vesicle glycoprotein 2A n=1 Tax=Eufriesea mexicana TaxID=516756 RepID=A0A310SK09_9HYME|nr:PREDICTED: synaptic vesicle glycoprotein 2A-like isoform X2 [Eufriesea mexicana]OAD57016.1 Synaptic vesicle glycoprotein 2A [Eufriesea mexicana]